MAEVKIGYLSADTLTNISNAIREKNGLSDLYLPSEMPNAIRAISTLNAETANATALSSDILEGKTAYVQGLSITGTIPSKMAEEINPSDVDQFINEGQYLSGNQTIKAVTSANLPSSLKEGKTVTASLVDAINVSPSDGKVLTGVTINAPDTTATAIADDILTGKTAYVNGIMITGTRPASTGGIDTSDADATELDIVKDKSAYVNGVKIIGTLEFINCYSGETTPSINLGNDGDIFLVISEETTVNSIGEISTSTNNITLSDTLPSDTYTLKYEDASNTPISEWAEIGTITI